MAHFNLPIDPMYLPKEGDVFSSYRDLARSLQEPINTGATMRAQMRRWLQQFTWERIAGTNKIRILPFVEPVVNLKLVENVEWFAHLAPQILQQLARAVNGNGCNAASKHFKELIISGTEAYLRFGLVNPTWLK
jgi:hypothetical protein